jgi:hypothetical protein
VSFTSFAAAPQATREQVMAMLIQVAAEQNMADQPGACIIAGITVSAEAGSDPYLTGATQFWCPANPTGDPETEQYPHDSESNDHASSGPFQQQPPWWATAAQRMSLHDSATLFMVSLARYPYAATGPDEAGQWAQTVQGSADPDAYSPHYNDVVALYQAVNAGTPTPAPEEQTVPTAVANQTDPRLAVLATVRPAFNEFANWCQNAAGENWESREGTDVDGLFVHTQEGAEDDDNAALDLSNFLISTIGGTNPVSYHDSVRQASDGGVTVVNSVDTDNAAWAVGNSNLRSINRCFAGSDASWTREQWLTQSKAIDVMAYLMVRDAIKYGIDATRITFGAPNGTGYNLDPPVLSDHRYCTDWLKDGNTHVDVGDGFPVDVYSASVLHYWAIANGAPTSPPPPLPTPPAPIPPTPTPPPAPVAPVQAAPGSPEQSQEIWDQLRLLWPQLGDQTIVNALGQIRDTVCGTSDYANWKETQ